MKQSIALKTKAQVSQAVAGPDGQLAAVDWKGNLYLTSADSAEPVVHGAHSERAQGVAFAPDGGVVTVGWDGLRSLSPRGDVRGEWEVPRAGKGFHRAWGVRVLGERVAVDVQCGAKVELWFGTLRRDGSVEMETKPRKALSGAAQQPARIAGCDSEAIYWRDKDKLIRIPAAGGKVTTVAKLPTQHAVWSPHGIAYVVGEGADRMLQLPDAAVSLTIPSDYYPIALSADRVAVATMQGALKVVSWDGSVIAEGKHTQCSGLAWAADGRLMSWGWDKKVRLWSGLR